jgi:hypothetical protein
MSYYYCKNKKQSRPIFNKSTRFEDIRRYDDERAPYRQLQIVGAEPHSTHGSVENVERKKINSVDTRCSAKCRDRQTACILAKLAQTSYNALIHDDYIRLLYP